jgi:hypothetical protein
MLQLCIVTTESQLNRCLDLTVQRLVRPICRGIQNGKTKTRSFRSCSRTSVGSNFVMLKDRLLHVKKNSSTPCLRFSQCFKIPLRVQGCASRCESWLHSFFNPPANSDFASRRWGLKFCWSLHTALHEQPSFTGDCRWKTRFLQSATLSLKVVSPALTYSHYTPPCLQT